jgi:hypothetical protein
MLKHHGRAAAFALGSVLAIGLPAGFVLAATSHDAHGVAVSTAARSTSTTGAAHGAAVSTLARGTHGSSDQSPTSGPSAADPSASGQNGPSGASSDTHGAAVSAVATDQTMVGGKNDDHGGAVSAVARSNAGSSHSQAPTPPTPNHGSAVSAAAQDLSTAGQAHGDDVSTVARGSH